MQLTDSQHIEAEKVVATLRRHPAVRDVAVVRSVEPGADDQLVGYVVAESPAINSNIEAEQVAKWRKLSEVTWSRFAAAAQSSRPAPPPDFSGWKSSYTGKPLPVSEMTEWVDQTVRQLLAQKPKSVLEIGCGLGLLLFRVAPHVAEYWATDIYDGAIAFVRRHVEANPAFANVKLAQAEACDAGHLPRAHFDLVVVNSVLQYFPSASYLIDVLRKAAGALRPGGSILLGDVRNLQLHEAFHLSVLLENARGEDSVDSLRTNLRRRVEGDAELALAPGFFHAVRRELPQITDISIEPQRGHANNEMTRFRLNAILRVGDRSPTAGAPIESQDWLAGGWTVDRLRDLLTNDRPERLAFTGVPNARTDSAARAVAALHEAPGDLTVGEFRDSLKSIELPAGVNPQDLWGLEQSLPYKVQISWVSDDPRGGFDLIITRTDQSPAIVCAATSAQSDWSRFASDPVRKRRMAALKSELDRWLKTNLLGAMVPSRLVVVDQLPRV